MTAKRLTETTVATSAIFPLNVPIHVPFTISRESLATAQIVLVEVRNEEGVAGLGECAPFPSLTYDTVESASAVALNLLEEIRGCSTQKAMERLRKLKPEAIERSVTGFVGVEGALWDLYAREQKKSLGQIWGAGTQSSLETDITLPIMDRFAIEGFWDIFKSYGFGVIKVKVSGQVTDDLDVMHELAQIVPTGTRYILDGNQAYSVGDAENLVSRLKHLNIEPLFFEQPLAEDDIPGLIRLAHKLPIPVCVDETVRSPKDLQRLLELNIKPIVNIKIMKSGIEDSLRIIALAKRAECPLMIGGMLESEVAMSLSLHMACATEAISFADLDTPFFFKERVAQNSPWHACSAKLQLPAGYGHGLSR